MSILFNLESNLSRWYTHRVIITKFRPQKSGYLLWPLLLSSFLSVGLSISRLLSSDTSRYLFLIWNLLLAWFPLLFAVLLVKWLKKGKWTSWQALVLSALWLGFLPNSFYLISDFIHLKSTGEVSILFDAVMFMSYAWNGLLLGFAAVYILHSQLLKCLSKFRSALLVSLIFILCSFAIYLGRYLSWNTWDILINPAGILFDLSERIVQPSLYPNTFTVTALFSVALIVMYSTVCMLISYIKDSASTVN